MFTDERQEKIEQYILKNDSASVQELSTLFSVSEVTIRKDLEELQKGNRIVRTHGGARVKYSNSSLFYFQDLVVKCPEEKHIIAQKALEFIEDGDTIFLDGSTTTNELAFLIQDSDLKELKVITSSLSVAMLFQENESYSVMVIGGSLNKRMNTVEGAFMELQMSYLTVEKAFIGINGIDAEFGFSTSEVTEASAKRAICRSANRCFVMADHTKFNKRYFIKAFDIDGGADYLITNDRSDLIDYSPYEEKISLILA
ncbi:MAG: DeoR/GlpR family DNA-binding transcription regulator [Eubacteriales bacterium]|nr:DeoR/GlpR family DNA-binding transcription regulator [Eubacteriales bacterium]